MKSLPAPGPEFSRRKQKILSQLAVPDAEYTDASPKGSVDAGIRDLIDQINARSGLVTTSSCAGRVSVYLEGPKTAAVGASADDDAGDEGGLGNVASSAGGKGGGEWLFVSHDPVEEHGGNDAGEHGYGTLRGALGSTAGEAGTPPLGALTASSRLVHFKFEPMILHVLTASPEHAQLVVQAGMEAGFRETGAVSLLARQVGEEATPMVAVRSMGLSFESLIGAETEGVRRSMVSPQYLDMLVQIANERFVENSRRIARFSAALNAVFAPPKAKEGWEDAQARKDRKRLEGLKRREELNRKKSEQAGDFSVDFILQQADGS